MLVAVKEELNAIYMHNALCLDASATLTHGAALKLRRHTRNTSLHKIRSYASPRISTTRIKFTFERI